MPVSGIQAIAALKQMKLRDRASMIGKAMTALKEVAPLKSSQKARSHVNKVQIHWHLERTNRTLYRLLLRQVRS
jgi:hypothetical protein